MSKTFRNAMLILSLAYLALGLVLTLWPIQSRLVLCYILGAAFVLFGAVRIVAYFTGRGDLAGMGLALGAASVALGLVLLLAAKAVVAVFGVLVGVAILADSILRMQLGFNLRRAGGRGWGAVLILAGLMLILGVVLLFDPFAGAAAATVLTGVALAVDGALNLISVIVAARTKDRFF